MNTAPFSPQRKAQLRAADQTALCEEILQLSRSELYSSMHFLDRALSALRFVPEEGLCQRGNGRPLGTDGSCLYYDPEGLLQLYRQGRVYVNRAYLHAVFHCLFFHFAGRGRRDIGLYGLSCDIAVEFLIDSLQAKALHLPKRQVRTALKNHLEQAKIPAFNAESIYAVLSGAVLSGKKEGGAVPFSEEQLIGLSAEFSMDNHVHWPESDAEKPEEMPPVSAFLRLQNDWEKRREAMQTALETGGVEAGAEEGGLSEALRVENRRRYDFRKFLRRFSVLREELIVDEDSFDYAPYLYGLSHYGNLPLIEPLETKEIFAVAEFVIAIDTSYSTSGALVRRFLEESYAALTEQGSYFRRVKIHILQCDDRVQTDQLIESREDLLFYMEHFRLIGNGGTDFRPVFSYVDSLIRQKKFTHLKGLLYFTDGKGIYPTKRPPYDTAFVFLDDGYDDTDVPPWAMKLVIRTEELSEPDQKQYKEGTG